MRPLMQTTSLLIMLGMAIGPQVARPFLGREVHSPSDDAVNITTSTLTGDLELHPVQILYLIMSTLNIGTAIVCMFTCTWANIGRDISLRACFGDTTGKGEDEIEEIPDSSDASRHGDGHLAGDKLESCSRLGCILLVIVALFGILYGGCAVILAGLLYTYLYEYLGWSVDASTVLLTMNGVTRCISNAVAMCLMSRWPSPTKQMIFSLVSLLIASVLMSVALLDERIGFMTAVGVIVAGLGSYGMCSTVITLVDETVHVRVNELAIIYSTFGVGSLLLPPVSGTLLYNTSVTTYPLLILGLTFVEVVLFVIYSVLSRVTTRAAVRA